MCRPESCRAASAALSRWVVFALALCLGAAAPVGAGSPNPGELAGRLSDEAFALLSELNDGVSRGGSPAMLAPVAGLAGDAQMLSAALERGDQSRAAEAMEAVRSDRKAVNAALADHPGALEAARWGSIETRIATLEKLLPPSAADSRVGRPGAGAPAAGAGVRGPTLRESPVVRIKSRVYLGRGVRVKGWLEGTALKSAGIYAGDRLITPIKLSAGTGRQRVNFDFTVKTVVSGEVIRVVDSVGRKAEAALGPGIVASTRSLGGRDKTIELTSSGAPLGLPRLSGRPGKHHNVAEIPSRKQASALRPGRGQPSLAPLANVVIDILAVVPVLSAPSSFQVLGRIIGPGISRAALYVDGRLARKIPLVPGGASSFKVTFRMLGRHATIRAYGAGSNYVETSIRLPSGGGPMVYGPVPPVYGVNPYAPSPYGVAPYGYGANPYLGRTNPYAPVNPYGSVYPYGTAPAPGPVPWWGNKAR